MRSKRNSRGKHENKNNLHLELKSIKPITGNQRHVFDNFSDKNLLLTGSAGTGKSFISIFLALKEILESKNYHKLIIIRSALPTRDIGFLKGNENEKIAVYEAPYEFICNELFKRGDAYQILKQKRIVEFMSTSFMRGLTFEDSIVLVDEIQNMTPGELSTIMTRIGKNTKIIFSGDLKQSDAKSREKYDFLKFLDVVSQMTDDFFEVKFTTDDIVRSGLVKKYLIMKEKLNIDF